MVCSTINVTLPRILCHCATNRKFRGSIPDKDIEIFYSFRLHCVPGLDSDSNINEDERCFGRTEGKGGRCVGLTKLPP